MALFPGLHRWAGTRKVKPIWILLEQEIVSGSGISWAICKSAPRSRQITMPAPHYSVFYRPDALPAAQPTVSKHWRHKNCPRFPQILRDAAKIFIALTGGKIWQLYLSQIHWKKILKFCWKLTVSQVTRNFTGQKSYKNVERFYYGCAKFQSWPSNSEILRDKNVKTLIISSQFLMKNKEWFQ